MDADIHYGIRSWSLAGRAFHAISTTDHVSLAWHDAPPRYFWRYLLGDVYVHGWALRRSKAPRTALRYVCSNSELERIF